MRILLITEDMSATSAVELTLAGQGVAHHTTYLSENGVEISKIGDYDIIILDLMLPNIDGYEILLRLRSAKINTPILILAGVTAEHKIKRANFGVADYLTKPLKSDEFIDRLQTIMRRAKGHSASIIQFDKVIIDLNTRNVKVNGVQMHLTNKEYAILELLAISKGSVLTKEMFLNHLYTSVDEPEVKIIDVFICKLRKKLADAAGGVNYIETVWGRGYMLKDYQ